MSSQKYLIVLLYHFIVFVACQKFTERTFLNNDLSEIPSEILQCYSNRMIWDRFNRLPYSVDSLIAIIRKIELSSQVKFSISICQIVLFQKLSNMLKMWNWSPGQLAATLVHNYRFDGIQYDRCKETFDGTPPLRLDLQV